jgi:hypothetical protein
MVTRQSRKKTLYYYYYNDINLLFHYTIYINCFSFSKKSRSDGYAAIKEKNIVLLL